MRCNAKCQRRLKIWPSSGLCYAALPGGGMRIAFVPEDEVTEQPEIEVREPEDEED